MRRAFANLLKADAADLAGRIDAAAARLAEISPRGAGLVEDGRLYLCAMLWWEAAERRGRAWPWRARMMEWGERATGHEPSDWYAARLLAVRLILLDLGVDMRDAREATTIVASNFQDERVD